MLFSCFFLSGIVAYLSLCISLNSSLIHPSLVVKSSRPWPLAFRNRVCEGNLGDRLFAQVSPDRWDCKDQDGTRASNDDAVEVRRLIE